MREGLPMFAWTVYSFRGLVHLPTARAPRSIPYRPKKKLTRKHNCIRDLVANSLYAGVSEITTLNERKTNSTTVAINPDIC